MKNPLNALKSINYKEFAVEHGEKVALSVVGLVILLALLFRTQWSRYDELTPDQLTEKVKTARQQITSSPWPDEERAELAATIEGPAMPATRIANMLRPVPLSEPDFGFNMGGAFWPVTPEEVRIGPINLFALTEGRADHGRLVIDVPLVNTSTSVDGDDAAKGDGTVELDEKAVNLDARSPFARRDGALAGAAGELTPGAALGERIEGFGPGGLGAEPMVDPEGLGFDGVIEDLTPASGYPTHYVSVRMLFPARDQLRAILNARGQLASLTNTELLTIQDFEIQRSQTISGTGDKVVWSDWKPYKLDTTLKLLDLVTDYDTEVVGPQVIDPSITMPLPMPKYGFWGPNADQSTHPSLDAYRLSDQERNALSIVSGAMAAASERFRGSADGGLGFGRMDEFGGGEVAQERQPGGWEGKVRDFKEIYEQVSQSKEAQRAVSDSLKAQTGFEGGLEALNVRRLSTMGEFLLFRFVDFEVEPGRAYRYQAKLTLVNPSFGEPLERVTHPSVAAEEYLETDWSEPTNAVVVPDDLEYYVESIDRGRSYREPTAKIRVHVWSENLGTWVSQSVPVAAGERVGGSEAVKADLADLVNDKFDEGKLIRFETDDVLADIVTTPEVDLDGSVHGEYLGKLGLPRLDINPPTMVLNEYGELVELDPAARSAEKQDADTRYAEQMAALKPLLLVPEDPSGLDGDPLGGGTDIYGSEGVGEGATAPRPQRRRRRLNKGNPLRIGGDTKLELPAAGSTTNEPFGF